MYVSWEPAYRSAGEKSSTSSFYVGHRKYTSRYYFDPSDVRARIPPTNDAILCRLRMDREFHHRWSREYFFITKPLVLSPRRSLSQISFDQIQDSCNKSTAIYWAVSTSYSAKKNLDHVYDGRDPVAMINSLYPQWFRGHHMDIEFGNFVAKLVCIETAKKKQEAMIQDIIAIHLAWCNHVIATLPRFAVEKIAIEDHGPLGINQEQNKYYKLRPLFRALIIIVDRNVSEGAEPVVY